MFEENDFDTLMERMLENVSDELDKREGSVIYDAIAPAALELANMYVALDVVMDKEGSRKRYLSERGDQCRV